MDTLRQIEKVIEHIEFNRDGQFASATLLRELVPYVQELVAAFRGSRHARWITIREACDRAASSRSKNFFVNRLDSLGGRSRLDVWTEQGLAEKTSDGLWLLHPLVMGEVDGGERDIEMKTRAEALAHELSVA